jgi:starch synthase
MIPSTFEPCGLSQMYAMRYGAFPVVSRTGGLADTVLDADAHPETGTGFVFEPGMAADYLEAVNRGCLAWSDKERRLELRQRGMAEDFSWIASAGAYEALYRQLVEGGEG